MRKGNFLKVKTVTELVILGNGSQACANLKPQKGQTECLRFGFAWANILLITTVVFGATGLLLEAHGVDSDSRQIEKLTLTPTVRFVQEEDGDGTVNGCHPNDLGMSKHAEILLPILKNSLNRISDLSILSFCFAAGCVDRLNGRIRP